MRLLYTFVVQFAWIVPIFAQETISDTIIYENQASFDTVAIINGDDDLNAPIKYKAQDSIVYDIENKMLYLYNGGEMTYDNIELESERVQFDWNTFTLSAEGVEDTAGNVLGSPIFVESGQEYASSKMEFNFRTGKGRTFDVITQQDEAYIHSEVVKKNEHNEWYGLHTKFTTCDNHDHPHFYIEAKRSKVVPDKVMVTGPANLVVEGINTPLYLPFAIFPLKKGKRSGIIFPQYGFAPNTGEFSLLDGGYYWAASDKLGLSFTGDIFTRGQFRLGVSGDYKNRYKYGGSFNFQYRHFPATDLIRTGTNGKRNEYSIQWQHRMDSKASQKHFFSANVNAGTTTFPKSTVRPTQDVFTATFQSNITYRRVFHGKPYSFTLSAGHEQSIANRTISIDAPIAAFNLSTIFPFQRKIKTDKKAFYENIGFSYNAEAKSSVNTIDSILFSEETKSRIQYGMKQSAQVRAPFNLLKYFSVNPSFTYNEYWNFQKENRIGQIDSSFVLQSDSTIDTIITRFQSDTLHQFFATRDFSINTNISTKLTGIYNFKGKKVKAMRHIITPTLQYNYTPDFTREKWGFYDSYYDEIDDENVEYNPSNASLYRHRLGKQNTLSFSLANDFDLKIWDKNDSTGTKDKNISIIDNLTFSGGYNFAADSFQINPLNLSARSSILNGLFTWNYNAIFTAYAKDSLNQRINATYWSQEKRFLQWQSMGVQLGMHFKGKNKDKTAPTKGTIEEREFIANNPQQFYDFDIPWDLRMTYQMRLANGHANNPDSLVISTQSLTVSGSINVTPKWKLTATTGYDFKGKDFIQTRITATRNLHCWVLSFDWTAYPLNRQAFVIDLHVLSPLLQELKLSRKNRNTGFTESF